MNVHIERMSIRVPANMASKAGAFARQTAKNIVAKMTHENITVTPESPEATLTIRIPAGKSVQGTAATAAGAVIRHIERKGP